MASQGRPLSPHLQIYRWQLTSVLSILHRGTGLALGVGSVLLVAWLIAVAAGPDAYAGAQWFAGSWLGRLLLFGWTAAFFYHLANGVRHLAWDAGLGFELPAVYRTGWAVVVITAVLTLVSWIAGYWAMGAFG